MPLLTSSVVKVGGHLDCVLALLEAYADVNIISDKGWWTSRLVCWPCSRLRLMSTSSATKVGGHLDCVLVSLSSAIKVGGHQDCLLALLEAHADVNIISDKGWWTSADVNITSDEGWWTSWPCAGLT